MDPRTPAFVPKSWASVVARPATSGPNMEVAASPSSQAQNTPMPSPQALEAWINTTPSWILDEGNVNWETVAKYPLSEAFILKWEACLPAHVLGLHCQLTPAIIKAFETRWNWQSLIKNPSMKGEYLKPYYKQLKPEWFLPHVKVSMAEILDNLKDWPLHLVVKTQNLDSATAIEIVKRTEPDFRKRVLNTLLERKYDAGFLTGITAIDPTLLSLDQIIQGVMLDANTLNLFVERTPDDLARRQLILAILEHQKPVPYPFIERWCLTPWILETPMNVGTLLAASPLPEAVQHQLMPMIVSNDRLILLYTANQKVSPARLRQITLGRPANLVTQVYLNALSQAADSWTAQEIMDLVKDMGGIHNVIRHIANDKIIGKLTELYPEIQSLPHIARNQDLKTLISRWNSLTGLQKSITMGRVNRLPEEEQADYAMPMGNVAKYWWRTTSEEESRKYVELAKSQPEIFRDGPLTAAEWAEALKTDKLPEWFIEILIAADPLPKEIRNSFYANLPYFQTISPRLTRTLLDRLDFKMVCLYMLPKWDREDRQAWLKEYEYAMDDETLMAVGRAIRA